ncbi:hypothetical protein Rwratislav_10213 [Rhodococcus wratislaviensis IFP 2016]|nr:hypothetical protein Rwratislav_10213 [Rhodococcus wratislaviensis IFP 2016]
MRYSGLAVHRGHHTLALTLTGTGLVVAEYLPTRHRRPVREPAGPWTHSALESNAQVGQSFRFDRSIVTCNLGV